MKISLAGKCPVCHNKKILTKCRFVGSQKKYMRHQCRCNKCQEHLVKVSIIGKIIYFSTRH